MQRRSKILLALLILVLLMGAGTALFVQQTLCFAPLPSFVTTAIVHKPAADACLNRDAPIGVAIELIDLLNDRVYLAGGANPISAATWETTRVRFPYLKNSTRHLLFDETCLFRSPGIADTCEGDDCFTFVELYGHSWFVLNGLAGQGCYPDASGCNGDQVQPGYVSITTIDKCQEIVFNGPTLYTLTDDRGNQYAMHATADGRPTTTGVPLPDGWHLAAVEIDEPLLLHPRGTDHCYFNIVRDAHVQSYHQVLFADEVFAPIP